MGFARLATVVAAGPATATNLNDVAKCLTRAGATYYTADWCPHCRRQDEMFGSALRYVHSVDCTNGCNNVRSFPTWTFRDGSRHPGVASVQELAQKTQCSYGDDRRQERQEREDRQEPPDADRLDDQREAAGNGATERIIGGAKIIEVPRR